jgi:hypothetical protein
MTKHVFDVDVTGLDVMKDVKQLFDRYFIHGHQSVIIPGLKAQYGDEITLSTGFKGQADDGHDIFLEWTTQVMGWGDLVDQNGGQFGAYSVDSNGLITTSYTLYDVEYENGEFREELRFDVTGYVITINSDDHVDYVMVVTSLEVE